MSLIAVDSSQMYVSFTVKAKFAAFMVNISESDNSSVISKSLELLVVVVSLKETCCLTP